MREMDKAFDFKTAQERWYAVWEASRAFEAAPESGKEPWSIVIPPPNITGNLHMGHALVNTLHDVLTRFKRAQGFDALWVPGTDHAGIATQMMVERQLKAEGTDRHKLGRAAFEQRIWDWKDKNQGAIEHQLKRLGCSVDWTRNRFTLDPALNKAVRHVFVESYKAGRIYRGPRMIQWDPALQTALSDLEVKYEERKGKLWHLRYPLAAGSGDMVVATTRPETMLGDTAEAVQGEQGRAAGVRTLLGQEFRARAVLLLVMGNGVMWLVYYAKFSPLPFRWVLRPAVWFGLPFGQCGCQWDGALAALVPFHSIQPVHPLLTQPSPPAKPALHPNPAGGSGPSWASPPACCCGAQAPSVPTPTCSLVTLKCTALHSSSCRCWCQRQQPTTLPSRLLPWGSQHSGCARCINR